MPENIVQFQVTTKANGENVVWALGDDGKIYLSNPAVGNGAWTEYSK